MYLPGVVPMPMNFRYRDVYDKGKPQHDRLDPFRIRHPRMPNGRRAKIFAPFDALKGFSEAVSSKDELYERRRELAEEDMEKLDRKLTILHNLTYNSRMARANQVKVTVTYYEPCSDRNSEAYGIMGQYRTVSGICRNVDTEVSRTIQVGEKKIALDDVVKIEGEVFREKREYI